MLRMTASASASEIGHVRTHNEDALATDPGAGVLIIADGMGGHAAGEVASRIAVDTVAAMLGGNRTAMAADALLAAHREVRTAARDGRGELGMGCTLVACRLDQGLVEVAWVGDSRAYLWRDGQPGRLSHDHSHVQSLVDAGAITEAEAETHPERNVLTRSIGGETLNLAAIGHVWIPVQPGDRILLCTDGLTGELDDAAIGRILGAHAGDQAAVDALVAAALDAGGRDNVSVVLATLGE